METTIIGVSKGKQEVAIPLFISAKYVVFNGNFSIETISQNKTVKTK
jgi:hypothetical protein